MIHVRFLLVAVIIQDMGLLLDSNNSGDIVHHVQQHFQFRFQLRHYSLLPYQKLQARQLRQLEQNI